MTRPPPQRPRRRLSPRAVRAALMVAIALSAPGAVLGSQLADTLQPGPLPVETAPIGHFDLARPDRTRFGALTFLGGLAVRSPGREVAGLSGLTLTGDGDDIVAVSDFGRWFRARLITDAEGRPTGLTDTWLGPILDVDGRPTYKSRVDAEAIAALPAGGFLVSLEGRGLMRFRGPDPFRARPVPVPLPPWLKRLPSNRGIEAIAAERLPGGGARYIAIAEAATGDGLIPAAIVPATPHEDAGFAAAAWRSRPVRAVDGFSVTDAAFLPDGGLLLLERRYDRPIGVYMRLRRISAAELAGRGPLTGEEILRADFGQEIDNMEGLAVHRDRAGRLIVTLISDDNRSLFQRTLLLRFRLDG
ncbi:esterase-like activity of phytase family protein [Pseudoxanthobacter sp.]|uniref:esterase-like activity of phytase family protein n=1 Tax=Pseudoxanthobacter sp. TaxID=1925742 RepID=UPI002FE41A7E